jgi:predicted metal-dependent hydrolase
MQGEIFTLDITTEYKFKQNKILISSFKINKVMYNNIYIYLLIIGLMCFVLRKEKPALIIILSLLILLAFHLKMEGLEFDFANPLQQIYHPPQSSHLVEELKVRVKPLLSTYDYNRLKIYDIKDKVSGKNVAWTSDKKLIYICTKNKVTGENEDIEVLMYVLLHELSHFSCLKCVDHSESFKLVFAKMLQKADELGIKYKRKNEICGVNVN